MGVTSQLLALYRVDQQLRGLKGRLHTAEKYLAAQERQIKDIDQEIDSLRGQLRQLEATAHNDETEAQGIRDKIATLRERMNNARTSKEHSAYLTEINTLKADMGLIEERALESFQRIDELRQQVDELEVRKVERGKVREVARTDRDQREAEIKDRLEELQKERERVAAEVPPNALAEYDERIRLVGEEVMAPVEEQSRRNMEYTCGSCFTHLPVEQVSILLKRGDLTACPSCDVILYMEDSLRESIGESQARKKKNTVSS